MVGCGTIHEVKGGKSLPDEDWLLVVDEATCNRGEIEVRFSLNDRRLSADRPSYQQGAYIGENHVIGEGGEGLVHNVSVRLRHPSSYLSDQDGRLVSVLGPCPWEVAETGGRP